MYGLGIAQSRPMRLGAFEAPPAEFAPAPAIDFAALVVATYDDTLKTTALKIQQSGRDLQYRMANTLKKITRDLDTQGFFSYLTDVAKSPFGGVFGTTTYDKALSELIGLAYMGDKWINATKSEWFDAEHNLAYEKVDSADAERVSRVFDSVVGWNSTVVGLTGEIQKWPLAIILKGLNDFWKYVWEDILKFIAELKELSDLLKELAKTAIKAGTVILKKLPDSLEWLPIILVAVGTIGVIYLLS